MTRRKADDTPDRGSLAEYRRKRDFARTQEPAGEAEAQSKTGRTFVVQKHQARRLHYDLRLEMDGVLKSWAVPNGPALDPTQKQLAVHTEDHPIEYGSFEGVIPEGEYGAGPVMIWDRGDWEPIGNAKEGYDKGDLKFRLHGDKLTGEWVLARMKSKAAKDDERNWLLIKKKDDAAQSIESFNILGEMPRSVVSGRTLDEIAAAPVAVWEGGRARVVSDDVVSEQPTGALAKEPSPFSVREGEGSRTKRAMIEAPSGNDRARRASMPDFIKPQLAVSAKEPPAGDDWLNETKLDGYRLIARIEGDDVRLFTRNHNDWTDRFPTVARALGSLAVETAFLDGEVVVLDKHGLPDFQALQNAFRGYTRARFRYFVFDVMYAQGLDLRATPLHERKAYLRSILKQHGSSSETLMYCEHIIGNGETVLAEAAKVGLEGIVSKRADSTYQSRRSPTWIKVKRVDRQDFVIGGYTAPSGSRIGFGALLLGCYNDAGELIYCGRVGTGFSDRTLELLIAELTRRKADDPPFANPEADPEHRSAHWVKPELVAEVEFSNWTEENLIRHPSFCGLREDVAPETIRRDDLQAAPASGGGNKNRPTIVGKVVKSPQAPEDAFVAGVRISHPDRTVYPDDGVTKLDVARYYEQIAEWILPHVARRPLSLVRCPLGLAGESFYQRQVGEGFPDAVRGRSIGEDEAIIIDDLDGLLGLVQMGTLEIHAWGCRADNVDRPDRLVFDLDPGPGILWEHIVASARFVRAFLVDLGLVSFVKTTGGNGVHLVVPIVRRTSWEDAKIFTNAVAREIANTAPRNFVATMSKALRKHRIFIDYLRNQLGATSIAVYSTRARNGATVSAPLSWDELSADAPPAGYNLRSVAARLRDISHDPWEGFDVVQQSITKAMLRKLGR